MFGDAAGLVLLANHKAGDVLQEDQRNFALGAEFNKVRALLCRFAKQYAVVAEYAHRVAVNAGETANQGGAVEGFEFVEFRTVDHAGDDLAHVVGFLAVFGHHAVNLFGVVKWLNGLLNIELCWLHAVETGDRLAGQLQSVVIILCVVVGNTGGAAVHIGTTEIFSADDFAGRRFYQGRATEKDGALFFNDNRLVSHGGHIGATGSARAHDHGDLRNTLR